ncbi:sigma-70 family RNA polymerase sigma factor [Ruania suaedae]|uniref:RNA polymerase sigma factor n=1 Tax=Ruania suaedae TaxID=2897774 RepID=UPI001E457DCE|nr:sigma-70 family RNA polymerase sigma factor [Ruania suaedae]UFU02986.1 sigma-70 family RNA polymerase sigma factor [Ruania suaedae]
MDPGASERELLARFRDLDPDAWETVYRRSYPRLRDFARRRLPAGMDADDAVSECLARAVHRVADLTDRGLRVEAWLFGILRLVVLEHQRSAGRHRREHPATAEASAHPAEHGPLTELLERELQGSVREAFSRLRPDDQEILWLRLVADLSAAEVGSVIGRAEGAVRQAQSRALERLRHQLKEVHP